jgi:hypothetical protein
MTTSSSQAGTLPAQSTPGTPGQPRTLTEALRAAADFIESSGERSGVIVACSAGGVSIRVSEPYGNAAARHAIVARLAALIGGGVRQEDERDFAAADLRADGAIGGLRAVVATGVDVRRTRPRTGNGRPLAEAPGGQITAVPGKLPDGWRWVTELDPEPRRATPRKQRRVDAALPAAEAPALAARDCPPLTGAALQAAARQEQATAAQPARPGSTAGRASAQPPW